MTTGFGGLELLATAVVVLDETFVVRYANPAAESLFSVGLKSLKGQPLPSLFVERATLEKALADALVAHWSYSTQNVSFVSPGHEQPETLSCMVTRIDVPALPLLVELRPIEQQLRLAREERLLDQQQASRELIRNLAHAIGQMANQNAHANRNTGHPPSPPVYMAGCCNRIFTIRLDEPHARHKRSAQRTVTKKIFVRPQLKHDLI